MILPPQIMLCPYCGAVAAWNNHQYILAMLASGEPVILMWCPHCRWSVRLEGEPGEPIDDWPF